MATNDKSKGCCDEPPCPSVSLLCNSVSASKTKCGYAPFTGATTPATIYKKWTQVRNGVGGTSGWAFTRTMEGTECFDVCSTPSPLNPPSSWCCSGSGSCSNKPKTGGGTESCSFDCAGWSCPSGPFQSGEYSFGGCGSDTPTLTATHRYTRQLCGAGSTFDPSHYTDTDDVLSDEYTTAGLKSDTVADLPGYATCFNCILHSIDPDCDTDLADGQGCTCSAYADLSSDETSYTIRRFKYKFRFTASVTCRLKILWNETFKPTLTAAVDFCSSHYAIGAEDPNPAHWTVTAKSYTKSFSGDPCGPTGGDASLPTPSSSPCKVGSDQLCWDSSVNTVNEPTTNGTTYITDIRWTILDGNNDTDVYNPAAVDYTNPCAPVAAQQNCIPAA